jgi:hypothetical protein
MENEEPEVLGVEVTTVVERFIAELKKVNRRIDALEVIVGEQQECLRDSIDTLKKLVSGRTDWKRPDAAKATTN